MNTTQPIWITLWSRVLLTWNSLPWKDILAGEVAPSICRLIGCWSCELLLGKGSTSQHAHVASINRTSQSNGTMTTMTTQSEHLLFTMPLLTLMVSHALSQYSTVPRTMLGTLSRPSLLTSASMATLPPNMTMWFRHTIPFPTNSWWTPCLQGKGEETVRRESKLSITQQPHVIHLITDALLQIQQEADFKQQRASAGFKFVLLYHRLHHLPVPAEVQKSDTTAGVHCR